MGQPLAAGAVTGAGFGAGGGVAGVSGGWAGLRLNIQGILSIQQNNFTRIYVSVWFEMASPDVGEALQQRPTHVKPL
jgi:hypothetical protein